MSALDVSRDETPVSATKREIRKVYETERVTLWSGDCADLRTVLPHASADLILTDPPYGVGYRSNFRESPMAKINGDDGSLDVVDLLGDLAHLLREGRHSYVFGYPVETLSGPMRLGGTADLIWDKGIVGMGDLSLPWGPQHETIAFGVHVRSAANRARGNGRLSARLRQGSVLRVMRPNSGGVVRHPTEKPTPLLMQLIESSTVRGDTVLDPFAGSMSTGVAALLTGRRVVLCENDERYIKSGIERLKAAEAHSTRGESL